MKNISIKAMIPNMLTAGNLWLGVLAIISALDGDFKKACIYVIVAAFLDGLDGKAARKLNVSSEFGKELDSLCDMVSFGAAPGILAYTIFLNELGTAGLIISILLLLPEPFVLQGLMC
jgi:CDP-diacylglycerol--serine O-phosphatidyltransferase